MRRLSVRRGGACQKPTNSQPFSVGRVCTGKSLALLKRTVIKRILGRHLRQNFNYQKLNQGLNATALLRGRSSLRMPPEPGSAVEAVEGEGGKKKANFPLSLSLLLLLATTATEGIMSFDVSKGSPYTARAGRYPPLAESPSPPPREPLLPRYSVSQIRYSHELGSQFLSLISYKSAPTPSRALV
ncbi:hypothetical protein B9Z19DRAFT_613552 [Tuber borchii]|uniref:Uncharacterized protein n=1 Tax=Tuber borchii TaxID=42251 RepID=A0A2T6ZBQ3_TUBBO|nr:hypothetical protein B9Z19DRAFT_613552 [Tuber borchii]